MNSDLKDGILCAVGRDAAKALFSSRDAASLTAAVESLLDQPLAPVACRGQADALQTALDAIQQQQGNPEALAGCVTGQRALRHAPELEVAVVRPDLVAPFAEALAAISEEALPGELQLLFQEVQALYRQAAADRAAIAYASAAKA